MTVRKSTRKAQVEGAERLGPSTEAEAKELFEGDAKTLGDLIERFTHDHPEDWEAMRLGPMEYGLNAMIEKLRG